MTMKIKSSLFLQLQFTRKLSMETSESEKATNSASSSSADSEVKILLRFTYYHSKSSEEYLGEGRFIPESSYVMARAHIHSVQDLIDVFPDLLSLTNYTSIKQAISDIVKCQ